MPDTFDEFKPGLQDIVNGTVASNPGHVRVQWTRFFRAYPATPVWFGLSFAIIGALMVFKSIWWGLPLVFLIPLLLLIFRHARTQFRSGDTVPGLIVSQNPPHVAFLTDLTTGRGEYPVVRICNQPIDVFDTAQLPIGARVVGCSFYSAPTTDSAHWSDFSPVIVQAATGDPAVIERKLASIPAHDWATLEHALAQLPDKTPGNYPLGWKPAPDALSAYTDKDKVEA